jgi:hypothetical protein
MDVSGRSKAKPEPNAWQNRTDVPREERKGYG